MNIKRMMEKYECVIYKDISLNKKKKFWVAIEGDGFAYACGNTVKKLEADIKKAIRTRRDDEPDYNY